MFVRARSAFALASRSLGARSVARSYLSVPRITNVQPSLKTFSYVRAQNYSVLSQCQAKLYKYEEIKDLVAQKSPSAVLIDVREPVEFLEGHIPGALNVPFKSSPGALDLSPEEFEESFGFEKPAKDAEVVFYCLGGVRSTAAEELANAFGYAKRGNYVGSWEDWVARENSLH